MSRNCAPTSGAMLTGVTMIGCVENGKSAHAASISVLV
jgi:hypothetical protein